MVWLGEAAKAQAFAEEQASASATLLLHFQDHERADGFLCVTLDFLQTLPGSS